MNRRLFHILVLPALFLVAGQNFGEQPAANTADLARAAQITPLPPLQEFESLWKKSLFAAPSTSGSGMPATVLSEWQLRGLMTIGDKKYAIIGRAETNQRMYVTSAANKEGFRLASIHCDPDPERETVTISVGEESAVLHYAPELLAQMKRQYQNIQKIQPTPAKTQ
ncbi:MAG: hypothetical protein PHV34_07830 [Verrucomicrobiae bacterium]|nr:hypothetical protein [Verrucomicrobiae bacterium]